MKFTSVYTSLHPVLYILHLFDIRVLVQECSRLTCNYW